MNHIELQIISDIHLNGLRTFYQIKPSAEYLFICGDVDDYITGLKYLRKFLKKMSPCFKKVIWILGNHELTCSPGSTYTSEDIIEHCRELAIETNTIFLHNESYNLTDNLVVIGSPLFCHIPEGYIETYDKNPVPRHLCIKEEGLRGTVPMNIEAFNELHEEAKQAIIKELRICSAVGKKAIIMTHYGPLAPKETREERDYIFSQNGREYIHYNTDKDMHEVLEECSHVVDLWMFGHCHTNRKFRFDNENADGKTSWGFDVVSNQLGRINGPQKYPSFDPSYVYQLNVE